MGMRASDIPLETVSKFLAHLQRARFFGVTEIKWEHGRVYFLKNSQSIGKEEMERLIAR